MEDFFNEEVVTVDDLHKRCMLNSLLRLMVISEIYTSDLNPFLKNGSYVIDEIYQQMTAISFKDDFCVGVITAMDYDWNSFDGNPIHLFDAAPSRVKTLAKQTLKDFMEVDYGEACRPLANISLWNVGDKFHFKSLVEADFQTLSQETKLLFMSFSEFFKTWSKEYNLSLNQFNVAKEITQLRFQNWPQEKPWQVPLSLNVSQWEAFLEKTPGVENKKIILEMLEHLFIDVSKPVENNVKEELKPVYVKYEGFDNLFDGLISHSKAKKILNINCKNYRYITSKLNFGRELTDKQLLIIYIVHYMTNIQVGGELTPVSIKNLGDVLNALSWKELFTPGLGFYVEDKTGVVMHSSSFFVVAESVPLRHCFNTLIEMLKKEKVPGFKYENKTVSYDFHLYEPTGSSSIAYAPKAETKVNFPFLKNKFLRKRQGELNE